MLSISNKIIKFHSDVFGDFQAVFIDGQAWLIGAEVCAALGYTNTRKALKDHVPDKYKRPGVTIRYVSSNGVVQNRRPTLINEAGLYKLVFASKMPKAIEFSDWVCEELLPTLRGEGQYNMAREAARIEGKVIRRTLNDTIKKFCDYLKERNEFDRPESTWHIIFTKLANKIVGVDDKRDNLPFLKVLRLQDCEDILAREIENGMAAGLGHHDIWIRCQEKLDAWQKLINE